jgi:hypothetical protein
MRRAKLALILIILCAQAGAFLIASSPAKAMGNYAIDFDGGGDSPYSIEVGETYALGGASGTVLKGVWYAEWSSSASILLHIPVDCQPGVQITGSYLADYVGTNVALEYQYFVAQYYSDATPLDAFYYRTGHQGEVGFHEVFLNYTPSVHVSEIQLRAVAWAPNSPQNYLDDISIQCGSAPEYDANHAAEATIDLGSAPQGVMITAPSTFSIRNQGELDLIIHTIIFTGDDAAAFTVNASFPLTMTQGSGFQHISLSCTPDADSVSATMVVSSNDDDESLVNYTVTCSALDGAWAYPVHIQDRYSEAASVYQATTPFWDVSFIDPYSTEPERDANVVYSTDAGQHVFAIASGTVLSTEPLTDMCANQPALSPQRAWTCVSPNYLPTGLSGSLMGPGLLYAGHENAYVITITLEDLRQIIYVVADPSVSAGDEVAQGCRLGKTLPFYRALVGDADGGYVLIQGTNFSGSYAFDLAPYISMEPNGFECARQRYSNACTLVSNPIFDGGANWSFEPDEFDEYPYFDTDGVGLVPVGKARQTLNLDPGQQYAISIYYHAIIGSYAGGFRIQLGAESSTYIQVDSVSPVETTIPDAYYTANNGNLYDLVIMGETNASNVVVDMVCVFDPDTVPPSALGGCIFVDPEFDYKPSRTPWTLSTTPAADVDTPGMASVVKDAYVEQSVSLHPKDGGANQEYTITAIYRREGKPQVGEDAGIAWTFASFSGTFTPSAAQAWQTDSDNFTIATDTVGPFRFTANGSVSNIVQIDRLCITTADGVDPPGYAAPVLVVSCKICTYTPTGDVNVDITEYVAWLGCVLAQLWECQFKSVLLGIWTGITNLLIFLGFFRMWIAGAILNLWTAGNSNLIIFARWLGGEIHNLTMQLLYGLGGSGSGGSGTNLWDAIIALFNLLKSLIDGIFGLLASIVDLFLALIGMLINLVSNFLANTVGMILSVIQGMVNGVNMTPSEMPEWFPDCADPSNPLIGVCGGLKLMEDELQQGPAVFLVPITFGIAIINLLMWGMGKFLGIFTGGDDDE